MKLDTIEQLFMCYAKLRLASVNELHEDEFAEGVTGFDEIDGIDGISEDESKQRKVILEVAQKLIKISDDFEKTHLSQSEVHHNNSQEGMSMENAAVPEQNRPSIVSRVLNQLSETVTPETFREAIQSLCEYATSVPIELALVMELSTQMCDTFQRNFSFIPEVLREHFHSRIDIEDIQDNENGSAND